MSKSRHKQNPIQQTAGNGLLDRRALLRRGVLFAGAAVARAGNFTNERDTGLNAHQTELDQRFTRRASSPTFTPDPPARNTPPTGSVPRHHPTAKRRPGTNR